MKDNKKFWDNTSKLYTSVQENSNVELFKSIKELSAEYVKDKDVLELACGTGQVTNYLAKYAKSYIATDYSKNMIEEAKKRNIKNVTFDVEDATNLSYKENSFDVVVIANGLHIMPNPDEAIEEIKRVLKPGGILIAPTFVYEGKVNKFRLFVIRLGGFKTYSKWKLPEYEWFLKSFDLDIVESSLIPAEPLSEAFVVCKKK